MVSIKKAGTVTISKDQILVQDFHSEGQVFPRAQIEMLEWARDRIDKGIANYRTMAPPAYIGLAE